MTTADYRSRPSVTPPREQEGLRILRRARARLRDARASRSDKMARDALALAASALNWLEDTAFEERAHSFLHAAGRWTRQEFPRGCALTWTGTEYEHRCPVNIAHVRLGFSPGIIVSQRRCSLCGEDSSECEHLPDREYEVPGGPGPLGSCRVCASEKKCAHEPSRTYWTRPIAVVSGIEAIDHVAIVARPVQPDARLTARPVDRASLESELGPTFRYGEQTVWCSQCLDPCAGLKRMEGDPRSEPQPTAGP